MIDSLGGLDPIVVEAAALAHDLGHPPFGHVAEEELHRLVYSSGVEDGFEGNAQSFRIVTRLETRESGRGGLDLTRATLNAMLKYPWLRGRVGPEPKKFGAYDSEEDELKFAHKHTPEDTRSLEAEIMDWADDITYAVHDLEDFYRIGRIRLERLAKSRDAIDDFLEAMFDREKVPEDNQQSYRDAAKQFFAFCPVSQAYSGRRTQRAALRGLASSVIHQAVTETTLTENGLTVSARSKREVALLKGLTRHFVIEDSSVATEQFGKRKIIQQLFKIFANAASEPKEWKMFPVPFQEQLADKNVHPVRTTADYIASMGEQRAVELYAELAGSSLKPVVTGLPL